MRIAIIDTRGIPANYGGFETFAEELSKRLVSRAFDVTVDCRSHSADPSRSEHNGAHLFVLPTPVFITTMQILSSLLTRVLSEKALVDESRQRTKARVLESYDWETVTDKYVKLFEELARR